MLLIHYMFTAAIYHKFISPLNLTAFRLKFYMRRENINPVYLKHVVINVRK